MIRRYHITIGVLVSIIFTLIISIYIHTFSYFNNKNLTLAGTCMICMLKGV